MSTETAQWTIEELVERANRALRYDSLPAHSRRVRDHLSLRQARLYTTLGLLSRPELRGRKGYYSVKHLMQLVAIKRLQSLGWSLVEIQNRLLGLSDEELAQIARIPPEDLSKPVVVKQSRASVQRRETAFWRQTGHALSPVEREAVVEHWLAIPLGDGIKLMVRAEIEMDQETLQALRRLVSQWQKSMPRGNHKPEGGNTDD